MGTDHQGRGNRTPVSTKYYRRAARAHGGHRCPLLGSRNESDRSEEIVRTCQLLINGQYADPANLPLNRSATIPAIPAAAPLADTRLQPVAARLAPPEPSV